MKLKLLNLIAAFIVSVTFGLGSIQAGECTNLNKVPICHKGAGVGADHKGVEICVDFGALWGHIAQHPHDQIGECGVDLEENLKVWACNAGLRHKDHNDGLCFDLNNGGALVANCAQRENCLCSGDSLPQSLYSFDNFSFDIAGYSQGQATSSFSEDIMTAGQISFNQASSAQGQSILDSNKGVTFNLGSERFGAEYFVDLCWEVLDAGLVDEPMKVDVEMSLAADIFTGNQGYLSNALVTQFNGIFCDKTTSSGPYAYSGQPSFTTSVTPFLNGTRSFSTNISGARSCFARLRFDENQNALLRPHELQQVTVNASINVEPVDNNPVQDMGLTFCHVQKIRGNKYQCFQQSFNTTDELRAYMTSGYNNIPDWRQDHNKDYRGFCRAECGPLTGAEANN